jgi:predicted nuclease with TOPRIM domain
MVRRIACCLILLLAAGSAVRLCAQEDQDPLSPDEVQEIRDNAIHPNERIKLYLKFLEERLTEIRQVAGDADVAHRKAQIRDKLEEFTHLCDELQDNMDTYDAAHADIRKSLKELVAASSKWPADLRAAGTDPSYDFSLKTAQDAAQSAADEAKQLSTEQDAYFQAHKDERHKNGNGPS